MVEVSRGLTRLQLSITGKTARISLGLVVGGLTLVLTFSPIVRANRNSADQGQLPSIGESATAGGLKVTLLDARRLTLREYREADGDPPSDWAGGGIRLVFLVENRPGQPLPPVLGNVRVLFGSKLYNPVTNALSGRPFSPYVVMHSTDRFPRLPTGVSFEIASLDRDPVQCTVFSIFSYAESQPQRDKRAW